MKSLRRSEGHHPLTEKSHHNVLAARAEEEARTEVEAEGKDAHAAKESDSDEEEGVAERCDPLEGCRRSAVQPSKLDAAAALVEKAGDHEGGDAAQRDPEIRVIGHVVQNARSLAERLAQLFERQQSVITALVEAAAAAQDLQVFSHREELDAITKEIKTITAEQVAELDCGLAAVETLGGEGDTGTSGGHSTENSLAELDERQDRLLQQLVDANRDGRYEDCSQIASQLMDVEVRVGAGRDAAALLLLRRGG